MKLQKNLVIPLVLIFGTLIILLSIVEQSTTFAQTTDPKPTKKVVQQPTTSAETTEPKPTQSVNDVSMRVVFHFQAGVEETTIFKVFQHLAGYDKETQPKFQLVGIVGGNTPLLHEATHKTFHSAGIDPLYSDFEIEVYLTDKYSLNVLNRFMDCNIKDFFIDVLYDKNNTWSGDKKFSWIETFVFECAGAHPLHPGGTEASGESSEEAITNKEPEEKEPSWEDFYP